MSARQRLLLPDIDCSYAQVAVPVPAGGPYSYRIPEHLATLVEPGVRVRVRFAGRSLVGVVTAVSEQSPADVQHDRIRDLDDCLDPHALLPHTLLEVIRRVAERYLVSIGEVAQLALGGISTASAMRFRLRPHATAAAASNPSERRFLEAAERVVRGARWTRIGALARQLGSGPIVATAYRLAAAGAIEIRDEWSGEASGRTVTYVRARAGATPSSLREAVRRAPSQSRLLEWVLGQATEHVAAARAIAESGSSVAVLRALETKGVLERVERAPVVGDDWDSVGDDTGRFDLTAEQAAALACIERAAPDGRPVLLHGVTGSGKTEVYLRAARATLRRGRSAILLVPEIGLTPQLRERARAVFGDRVAVLHSGMAAGERATAWWRLRRGDALVAVGPRSALFAPLAGVGLIVVDEEQDSAYKQEERPRYDGRDVALMRAEIEGAQAVLGSATPSVETSFKASTEDYHRARMSRRVASRPLPAVELVDMRREWKESGRTLLSRRLEQRTGERLERGEQVLVLLNRRGFASALICRVCGARAECPDCAVSLTLHRGERLLRCHYCDHSQAARGVCSQCGADALHDLGHGTERLEMAIQQVFPSARVGRFDADQTRRRGAHARILAKFGSRQIDVLVGTQMLAKGHDFPGVTLVGVIGADAALGMPDFRAAERTFQLLTQMAGRAGRGEVPGQVVLQAHQPGHYAIEAALEHDYERFYASEIEYRRRLRYPPFVSLASCVCRSKVAGDAKEDADRLAAALRRRADSTVTVLGPATPPIARLRGQYRVQVLVKGPDRDRLADTLREVLAGLESARRQPRDLVLDIDPRNMM